MAGNLDLGGDVEQSMAELALYDLARRRLQSVLAGQLPATVDVAGIVDDYAYFVCLAVSQKGLDWEEAMAQYIDSALRRGSSDRASHCQETNILHRALAEAQSPVLDIGTGWGRMAPVYGQAGLGAVFAEPNDLGTHLLRRTGYRQVVCAQGESLPFADGSFPTMVIGWVLHHDPSPEVDAASLLGQAARVINPGGLLFSVEPVRSDFRRDTWNALLTCAGFEVERMETFFETETRQGEIEQHTLASSRRQLV